jgi:uncharacterized protein YeaO (DUF488 family)
MISLARVYGISAQPRGAAFLVERLWPRGIRKDKLPMDAWLKDAAPSTELRKWFGHEPDKWGEFQKRYFRELDSKPESWAPLLDAARRGPVSLLYSSADREHNNAVALKLYLEAHLGRGKTRASRS